PRARNPAIPPTLEALIVRLLAKDPGDRFASGQLVAQALREEIVRFPQSPSTAAATAAVADWGPVSVPAPLPLPVPAAAPGQVPHPFPVPVLVPSSEVVHGHGPLVVDASDRVSADTPTMAAMAPVLIESAPRSATTLSPEALRATSPLVRGMLETVLA